MTVPQGIQPTQRAYNQTKTKGRLIMDGAQDVCLFSRKRMELTGIEEVESFTEEQITVLSSLGKIAVEGRNLKIESFSTERGELHVSGEFDSFFYYAEKKAEKKGILSRLLG